MISHRCCLCDTQLEKQKHEITKLDSPGEATKKGARNGIISCHGALLCPNKAAHGGRKLTWSRDINAAKNMTRVIRYSYNCRAYTRPPALQFKKKP